MRAVKPKDLLFAHRYAEAIASYEKHIKENPNDNYYRGLSLSPFLNHWPPKISYDFLALTDGLVDRLLSTPRDIWKGARMPWHRFPPPVFLGHPFLPPPVV